MIPLLFFFIFESEKMTLKEKMGDWNLLERSLLYSGFSACILATIGLIQFAQTQYDVDELTLWPALVVLLFPVLFVLMLHHRGKDAYESLIEDGYIPGFQNEYHQIPQAGFFDIPGWGREEQRLSQLEAYLPSIFAT